MAETGDENLSDEGIHFVVPFDDPPSPGPAPPPPDSTTPPQFYTDEHFVEGPYNQYAQDVAYVWDEGVRVQMTGAPYTNTTTLHEVVRVGKPMVKKVVYGTAEREADWPVIPHWSTGNANEVLVTKKVIPSNPLGLEGRKVYRLQWEYVYYLLDPTEADQFLPTGISPVEKDADVEDAAFPIATATDADLNADE